MIKRSDGCKLRAIVSLSHCPEGVQDRKVYGPETQDGKFFGFDCKCSSQSFSIQKMQRNSFAAIFWFAGLFTKCFCHFSITAALFSSLSRVSRFGPCFAFCYSDWVFSGRMNFPFLGKYNRPLIWRSFAPSCVVAMDLGGHRHKVS